MAKRTFEQWMVAVDKAVLKSLGISVHDFPDCPFKDWYAAGVTPTDAARIATRE